MRVVFAPKVAGTRNIMSAARTAPLAALKLFSSVAASLGSGGQANYAAANAVMDCWAAQKQAQVSVCAFVCQFNTFASDFWACLQQELALKDCLMKT